MKNENHICHTQFMNSAKLIIILKMGIKLNKIIK